MFNCGWHEGGLKGGTPSPDCTDRKLPQAIVRTVAWLAPPPHNRFQPALNSTLSLADSDRHNCGKILEGKDDILWR